MTFTAQVTGSIPVTYMVKFCGFPPPLARPAMVTTGDQRLSYSRMRSLTSVEQGLVFQEHGRHTVSGDITLGEGCRLFTIVNPLPPGCTHALNMIIVIS